MQIRTSSLAVVMLAGLASAGCGKRDAVTVQRLGSAEAGPERSVLLTAAKPDSSGGVFRNGALEILAFRSEFRFSIADGSGISDQCEGTRPGGDGLAFVLLGSEPKQLGSGGSGFGYQGLTDSVAVEFDIACNRDNGDPAAPHIAIDVDGAVNHLAPSSVPPEVIVDERSRTSFDDGAVWSVWIDYREGLMEVRIARDGKRPEQANLQAKVPARLIESRKLWAGFTAANGKGASKQSIVGWKSEWVMVPRTSTPPGPIPPPRKELLIGPAF